LLVLRITLGATIFLQGVFYLFERGNSVIWAWFLGLTTIVCGVSLVIGFLTPVSGLLVCLGVIFFTVLPASATTINLSAAIFVIAVSASIVMVGPGAFSLDARMFGRRELIIPDKSKSPKS
jgi:uncharacterized membrane protein YphA (DoxX/SURF4 family)